MAATLVADAATAASSAPDPSRACTDLAAAKALMFLCLACLWVAFAGVAAATVVLADRDGEGSPVVLALIMASIRAILFAILLALVAPLLVLRAAACDAGFREELSKVSGASAGSMLHDTAARALLATLPFILLSVVGLSPVKLSPVKGSRTRMIGTLFIVVGVEVSAAVCCFVILPSMALKLWRMKRGGAAAACSIV